MFWRRTIYSCTILALLASSSHTLAAEPTLKEIMQALRDDLVQVLDGLLLDDPARIAIAAQRIADHPEVSVNDRQRVTAELQEEMAQFAGFDHQVHSLAVSIEAAARAEDLALVRAETRQLIDGCLACHSMYKNRIADVLSEARPEN
ncbi:MAG TPA: hypothetical protein PKK10_13430 [Woeseiaceae bacterium]|nr:hypothetical protein [Woeseiaceae bacterium]